MKVSCILTSYNRPKMVMQALKSVSDQTHRDFQLIVLDESDIPGFDIHKVVSEFKFQDVKVCRFSITAKQKMTEGRLAIKINIGLKLVNGDLVCFLCDDDYFYKTWFEMAVHHFVNNKDHAVIFGSLRYSTSMDMVFPDEGHIIFPGHPVIAPGGVLNHCQVMHRKFKKNYQWPEGLGYINAPDGTYFNLIAQDHVFFPVLTEAVVRRAHANQFQGQITAILNGTADGVME